ncbi:hypothetical protein A2U01_0019430, partial [Trifolium medium]|nr:hypothetical protein [Trifolium medium]
RGFTLAGRYNGQQNNEFSFKHNLNSKGEKPRPTTQVNEKYFPQAFATLALNDTKDQSFIVDSGATSHMINDADVLVVPDLKNNLLSVGKFVSDNHCSFEFTSSGFVIKDQNQRMIARGHKKGQLYTLEGDCQEALSAIRGGSSST